MLNKLQEIAYQAGQAIMEIYNSEDFNVELKGDGSPLTRADKAAHVVIAEGLEKHFAEIPVLSEEGKNILYDTRKNWRTFFLVDPLDGTKEFIKRNGEFTVNIALIKEGNPIAGVVYAPVLDTMYAAELDASGHWQLETGTKAIESNVLSNAEVKESQLLVASSQQPKQKPETSNQKPETRNHTMLLPQDLTIMN